MGDKKTKSSRSNKNNYNNDMNNNNEELREMLEAAIEDEITAAAMYATMANMVENPVLKSIMFNIAGDEFAHARTLLVILELIDCVETV